jgi:hypothetical protein
LNRNANASGPLPCKPSHLKPPPLHNTGHPQITTLPVGDAPPPPPDAPPGQRLLRSRCFVNGATTSLRVLRAVAGDLVDTNGQHAAVGLRDGGTQLALLDRIAGEKGAVRGGAGLGRGWPQAAGGAGLLHQAPRTGRQRGYQESVRSRGP